VKRWPLLAVAALALAPAPAAADDPHACAATFNPDVARRIFDRISAAHGADGCILDDVRTERSRIEIVWKRAGTAPLPPIVIEPSDCATPPRAAGDPLSVATPEAVARACPDAARAVVDAVRPKDLPTARVEASYPFWMAVLGWLAMIAGLAGATAVAVRALGGDDEAG